jgi:hypothetical protein
MRVLCRSEFVFFFFFFWAGNFLNFPARKTSRHFVSWRRRRSFNAPTLVVEVRPRVGFGVAAQAAVRSRHNDHPSVGSRSILGLSKRFSRF